MRAATKRWREAHRDAAHMATRNWQKANPEMVRAQKRRWYRRHGQEIKAKNNAHYWNNRGRIAADRKRAHDERQPRVSLAELKGCRQDPREAKKIRGEGNIVCLECGAILESLVVHLSSEHGITTAKYKEKWGYNRKTALICESLRPTFSRMARSFLMGRVLKSRRQVVEKLTEMLPAARQVKKRLEYRLDRRDKYKGKARPELWKRSADGRVATDLEIARLYLRGVTRTKIARAVGLKFGETVSARLLRMGFPSARASIYDRGGVVTGHNLLDLCRDANWSRRESAERLRVSLHWVENRMSPSRVERSLPVEMAKVFLAVRRGFLDDYRRQGATARGGRPRVLLPSERESLPAKYRQLRQELKQLRRWLLEQSGTPNIDQAWEWLCEQLRQGKLRTLLFWPQFLLWLRNSYNVDAFLCADWAPNELTLQFLADEYDVSEETVKRVVFESEEKPSVGTSSEIDPLTIKLIRDLHVVFSDQPAISSADLVSTLTSQEKSPWNQLGLTSRRLADRLRPLGITSRNVRITGTVVKGYTRKDFEVVWKSIA